MSMAPVEHAAHTARFVQLLLLSNAKQGRTWILMRYHRLSSGQYISACRPTSPMFRSAYVSRRPGACTGSGHEDAGVGQVLPEDSSHLSVLRPKAQCTSIRPCTWQPSHPHLWPVGGVVEAGDERLALAEQARHLSGCAPVGGRWR